MKVIDIISGAVCGGGVTLTVMAYEDVIMMLLSALIGGIIGAVVAVGVAECVRHFLHLPGKEPKKKKIVFRRKNK